MDLEEKYEHLSVKVAENDTEIKGMKKRQESMDKKLDEFQKFAIAMEAGQEARDKSLNRLLVLVTILSAVMPWVTKFV